MENNLRNAYEELSKSFSHLTIEEKRKEITNKINEMSDVINQIDPIDDIPNTNADYTSEDEYLCYLNGIIYNFENKIGNIFKSILQ